MSVFYFSSSISPSQPRIAVPLISHCQNLFLAFFSVTVMMFSTLNGLKSNKHIYNIFALPEPSSMIMVTEK